MDDKALALRGSPFDIKKHGCPVIQAVVLGDSHGASLQDVILILWEL